jgi:hypothetical protein
MKRWYDAHGLRLTIETQTPDLIAPIEPYVAPFSTEAFDVDDYSIVIGRGSVEEPPDGAEIISEGDIAPGIPSRRAVKGEHSWLLVPGHVSIMSDRARKVTEICIRDGCDRLLQGLAGIEAIDGALGAALALPGDVPRALLIFAPSGAGKTTTALALALGGFGLITDDAVVLQPWGYRGQQFAHVWGLPRPLKVHRRTADLLPAIVPLLGADWDSAGEQPLQTAALDRLAPTVPPFPIPVAAIATLGQRSASGHHIAPLDKAKALVQLAQDNLRRSPRGVLPDHVARFAALGALLATTPAFELRVGPNLALLPEKVAHAYDGR